MYLLVICSNDTQKCLFCQFVLFTGAVTVTLQVLHDQCMPCFLIGPKRCRCFNQFKLVSAYAYRCINLRCSIFFNASLPTRRCKQSICYFLFRHYIRLSFRLLAFRWVVFPHCYCWDFSRGSRCSWKYFIQAKSYSIIVYFLAAESLLIALKCHHSELIVLNPASFIDRKSVV